MAEALATGVIEITGDARKLRVAIEEAKKSFRTLGEGQKDISRQASASIDRYIGRLQAQNAQVGKSAREQQIFNLSMRGASNEQINLANSVLRVTEANQRNAEAIAKSANIDRFIFGLKEQNAEFGKSQSQIELYRLALQGASQDQLKAAEAEFRLADQLKKSASEKEKAAKAAAATAANTASIDQQISAFKRQGVEFGKTKREAELYGIALQGASREQLKAADSALKVIERQERMASVAKTLRTVFLTLGAATASALTLKLTGNINFLDQINKLSKSTGIARTDLVGLSLVAEQTGTNIDGLASAISKMTVEMGKDSKAFKELGITATDPLEAFGQLADLFNNLTDLQQKNALANKVFGRSWAEVAGTLQEGSRRLQEGIEKGKQLAGVTDENVAQADQFKSAVAELTVASRSFGAEFIPILTKIVNLLVEGKAAAKDFFPGGGPLGLRGALGGPKNDAEELAKVEQSIARVKEQRDAFKKSSEKSLFGRLFNADDLSLANKTLDSLNKRRTDLKAAIDKTIPELGSHSTPEEDNRRQAALAAAQASASSRAAKFLDEGKKGPTDDAAARARALAREQLEFDISEIRKAGELRVDAFQNAERILEAQRSASLVDDRNFFESKRAFIQLITQEQERAFQQEAERLKRETTVLQNARRAAIAAGDKDKIGEADRDLIDNARKIAEAQAKITKTQSDAVIATKINEINTTAAFERIEKSIREAKVAADEYIESIQRANARELAGIGRGQRFRETQAGFGQIEDRALGERRRLQGELRRGEIDQPTFDRYIAEVERTFKREIELYEERTAAIEAAQSDWINGAREALENYLDNAKDIAKQFEDVFTRGFQNAEDLLLDFSNLNFKTWKDAGDAVSKFALSVANDLARIEIRRNITGPLAEWLRENGRLEGIGNVLGIPRGLPGGTPPISGHRPIRGVDAEVVEGTIAKADVPGLGQAANAAQFTTAVTTAGTTVATTLTTAASTASTELTAAGATFAGEITPIGATLGATLTTAATTFATAVTTAGTTFAASVNGASATSTAGDIADIFGGLGFSEGGPVSGPGAPTSDSIPAMLSNQEFVVRAAKATEPGAQTFLQTFNDHGLATALMNKLRAYSLAQPKAVSAAARSVIPFARGGIVTRPEYFQLPDGNTGLRGEAGPEAIMPLRVGETGAQGVIVAGLPNVTLPVIRDAAGNMAVELRGTGGEHVIERLRETNRAVTNAPAARATPAPFALPDARASIRPFIAIDAQERVLGAPARIAAAAVTAAALSMPLAAAATERVIERGALAERAASIIAGPSSIDNSITNAGGSVTNAGAITSIAQAGPAAAPVVNVAPVLGSFETGTRFVPQTGHYLLHQGEAVVPKNDNGQTAREGDINITVHMPATDMATANQVAVRIGNQVALARARRFSGGPGG